MHTLSWSELGPGTTHFAKAAGGSNGSNDGGAAFGGATAHHRSHEPRWRKRRSVLPCWSRSSARAVCWKMCMRFYWWYFLASLQHGAERGCLDGSDVVVVGFVVGARPPSQTLFGYATHTHTRACTPTPLSCTQNESTKLSVETISLLVSDATATTTTTPTTLCTSWRRVEWSGEEVVCGVFVRCRARDSLAASMLVSHRRCGAMLRRCSG